MARPTAIGASPKSIDPITFINRLTHTGDYNGHPFRLRQWQASMISTLFGTKRPDGQRRYKRAFWAFGRKSGKTELVGAIIVYLLLGQGKSHQEIYSCSGDRKQASLVWKAAATMIRNDPYLSKLCHIYEGNVKKITVPHNGNTFEALSSDAPGKHGFSPSTVIFDEVHIFPNRSLHDALSSAFGARKDRLSIYITTAGNNKQSLCYELWKYAESVIEDPESDPELYPVIYQADPSDDWTKEATWRKALPGLGDFTSLEFIQSECMQAEKLPSYEATFKQLFLNLWVEDLLKIWIPTDEWSQCQRAIDWRDFEGADCYGGLDLSRARDLSAFALVFEVDGILYVMPKFWVPAESARLKENADRVPFMDWERKGYVSISKRRTVNYAEIRDDILELRERFNIIEIGYDKWNADELCEELSDEGLLLSEYPQNYSYMNPPCRKFERLVAEREIAHDGNPCLAWNVSNCILETYNEAIRPSKGKSRDRIDGLVATLMAIGVLIGGDSPTDDSPYNERGLIFI